MSPATQNAIINLGSLAPAANTDAVKSVEERLEDTLKEMRELKTGQELNAREIGLRVKKVIDERLWEPKYRNAEDCLAKKLKEIAKLRTLYRWKAIAERFSDAELRQFGISLLDALLLHETDTGDQLPEDNRGEYQVRLTQKDGSEVVKKLKDCFWYDLTRSNNNRRKPAAAKKIEEATTKPGLVRKAVLAGVGVAMLVVADLLPPSWLSAVGALVGASLLVAGGNPLVRRGYNWLASFIRSGQAIELLATMPSKLLALSRNVVHGAHWLWSFIRSGRIIQGLSKLASRLPGRTRKQNGVVPSAKAETPAPLTSKLSPPSTR